MDILKYYPILFVLGFLVMIFVMYQDSMHKSFRNKKQENPSRSISKGVSWRCLAVFELSILIGIITLKSALETATRHFSQLLIRVIPKKCRQMSSSVVTQISDDF